MKKSTFWVGVFATGLLSSLTTACSSTPDDSGNGGTGGTGVGGSGGSGGGATVMPIVGEKAYQYLTGAEAMPNAMPAPAAWEGKTCKTCHGANGEGFMLLAPEIRHTPAVYANYIVRHGRINNGVPSAMVDFPPTPMMGKIDITDADLAAIITWLDTMPKPTTGQGLYRDYCANCHGRDNGTGGAVGVPIVGLMTAMYGMKVRAGEGTDQSMRIAYMPPEDATALSDAEIGLIAQYLMAK
jgi:mono/diheme cytochrome c family protein